MEIDRVGIGTKEKKKVEAKNVQVLEYEIKPVEKEENGVKKPVGNKLVLLVKHPDAENNMEISKVKYEKNSKLEESGLWVHEDEDGLIPKKSALAAFLRKYSCINISEIKGKEIETVIDKAGYLIAKGY